LLAFCVSFDFLGHLIGDITVKSDIWNRLSGVELEVRIIKQELEEGNDTTNAEQCNSLLEFLTELRGNIGDKLAKEHKENNIEQVERIPVASEEQEAELVGSTVGKHSSVAEAERDAQQLAQGRQSGENTGRTGRPTSGTGRGAPGTPKPGAGNFGNPQQHAEAGSQSHKND
jgi:hypothetical protein